MIKERPQVIAIQELTPAQPAPYDWPFPNITQDQWISGNHEELQQRILVLLEPARNGYQREQENQRLREEKADLEEENELLYRCTVEPLNSNTVIDHLLKRLAANEGKTIEDERTALYQWHAQQLNRGELTPLPQDQAASSPTDCTQRGTSGYEEDCGQRQEADRLSENREQGTEEHHQDHQSTGREDRARISGGNEPDELHTFYRDRYFSQREENAQLRQQLTERNQLIRDYKQQYETPSEIQLLREKISIAEEMLDMDLDDLIDNCTVAPSNSETPTFSPYDPKRFDTRLTNLKSKYQHAPDMLLEEVEQIARSYCQTLDSNYRRDQDRREREDLRKRIQQVTELIAAEKDVVVGLVEENMSHYPTLDAEMTIPVGQFNQRHVGVKDDTTVTKKFRALHKIGVLLDYIPGTIDKSNPERPFTTPARIRLNPDLVRNPNSIKKSDDDKPGGNRQNLCKNPECINNDPHNEADILPPDPFKAEYCRTCKTTHISGLPGIAADANAEDMLASIREGRVLISEQLHRFAENAKEQAIEAQKHDAFEETNTPVAHHIYVDDIKTYENAKAAYKQWCHMATNGPIEDLHAMADQIGLKREWFQNKPGHPHYDLTPSKRKQAILHGAIAVSSEELIRACHPRLAAVMDGQKHNAFGQLYEIGYRSPQALDQIDQALQQDDSLIVVDIRYTPASRNPEWTKTAFEKRYGSRYTWLRNLGNINHHEKGNIRIADPEKGIAQLTEIVKDHSAILLCGCPEYEECHRKTVADLFQQTHQEHRGGILPLTVQADDQTRCTTCQIPIEKAEDFYFTEDGTGYCYQHGPQARPQIGQRVETPAGLATISNITDCPILHRLRCSVTTDQVQANGSHYATFDLSEVHIAQTVQQNTLLD